jgi:hypothetical protein
MQTGPAIAPSLQPQGPTGTNLQQIDTDLQQMTRAMNRLAESVGQIVTLLTPATPQIVTGSRASGAALESLLTALANAGIIVDSTTP